MPARVLLLVGLILLTGQATLAAQAAPAPPAKPAAPGAKVPAPPGVAAPAGADSCVTCHEALGGEMAKPVQGMREDIHAQKGLSCASCHGGNPKDPDISAMDPAKGFVGKPRPQDIPQFCARCHSNPTFMRKYDPKLPLDQFDRYWTSIHGKRLKAGDVKVASCVSCHGVHGILPASNVNSPVNPTNVPRTCARCHADKEYMKDYKIPTDQLAKYTRSVHGQLRLVKRDPGAPACNTCHGNHGAFPPGASSVADTCGQCHVINRDLFIKSPHLKAFDAAGLPECATCHGNHDIQRTSDDMLGVGEKAICTTCHTPDSAGYKAAALMRQDIDRLKAEIDKADATLTEAERRGMEVSEARFEFQNAKVALIKARNEVHAFSPAALGKVAADGIAIAKKGEEAGQAALEQLAARKQWSMIPLALIGVILVTLVLKIREIERRNGRSGRG